MTREIDRAQEARAFLEAAGWGAATLTPLPGDASTRRYARAVMNGRRAMLMDQPQHAEQPACPPEATSEERRALGYNAVARLAGADCGRFISAANFLRSRGLSAPEIYAGDTARGFVLIEDLGDDLFANVLADAGKERTLYAAAIEALVTLQLDPAPELLLPDKPLYAYDETALIAETDLMVEWFMPLALGRPPLGEEVDEHRAHWQSVLRNVLNSQRVFVHRDYHAQNLMWLPGREGAARVGLIDFQDAVAGTRSYDLISLLEDARRDVPPDIGVEMTDRYLAAMSANGAGIDVETHRAEMAVLAAQRNTKIVGIFTRLAKRDGKTRYLDYLPRVWGYLNRDLEHPSLAPLKAWYGRTIPHELRSATPRVLETVS